MIENLKKEIETVRNGPDNITYNGVTKGEYIAHLQKKIDKLETPGIPLGFESLEEYYKAVNR